MSHGTPPTQESDDAQLVARVRDGDRAACEQLLDRWFDRVFGVALARLRDREAAEDLTQEVFLRVWLHVADLRDQRRFGPWIMRMTGNLALMWRRAGARRSKIVQMVPWEDAMTEPVDDRRESAPELLGRREQDDALRAALARLSPAERELVRLHFEEERTQRDTASALGVHHTTIGRRVSGVLDKLRASLAVPAAPLAPRGADPRARARAHAILIALGGVSAGVRDGIAATSAATAPTWAALTAAQAKATAGAAAGVSQLAFHHLSSGLLLMTTTQKLLTATATCLLLASGVWIANPAGTFSSAASAPPPQERLAAAPFDAASYTNTCALAADGATVTVIPFGATWRLDLPGDNAADLAHVVARALPEGALEVTMVGRLGGVEHRRLRPSALDSGAEPVATSIQVWHERQRLIFESMFLEQTPEGIKITVWRRNRPDILAQVAPIEREVKAGRLPVASARTRVRDLFEREGLFPPDGPNRALLERVFDSMFP